MVVTARLAADPRVAASAQIAVTPGFLQPLTPENVTLGANTSVTVTGKLAIAGGNAGIRFALADSPYGSGGGQGTLGPTTCQRSSKAFTSCTATYTAPAIISSTGVTHLVAGIRFPARQKRKSCSTPRGRQSRRPPGAVGHAHAPSNPGDNNKRRLGNTIADCCSGTLGALIEDNSGKQYLLSNNHVLARSDHAAVGDAIVQPGLIDNNCTPSGEGPGTVPVGSLSAWLPLRSAQTNADAAIAQVASRTVDATGGILEFGARQSDGTLGAAPPGISSTAGKGETAALQMRVAKSGRTRFRAASCISPTERVLLAKTRLPTGTLPASKRMTKGGTVPGGIKARARLA